MKVNLVCDIGKRTTGMSQYAQQIYNHLLKKNVDVEIIYVEPKFIPQFVFRFLKLFGFDLYTAWKNYPIYLNFSKTQRGVEGIWHFSNQQQAFLLNYVKPKRSVITVHDIIPIASEFKLSSSFGQFLFKLASKSIKKADRILVDSENTKKDIIRVLHINPKKIDVVYLGVDFNYFKKLNVKRASRDFTITYIGSEMPRKNFETLIKAFAKLKQKLPNVKLVKVGEEQWPGMREKHKKLIKQLGLNDFVIFKDYVEDLPKEYNKADLFVFPSLYEGFGLPPLEAMACGCPVVCSNATSLPEVGGDAVLYFNPNDSDELADKIYKVLTDKKLKNKLVKKGLARAKQFSWEKCAKETIKVYRELNND